MNHNYRLAVAILVVILMPGCELVVTPALILGAPSPFEQGQYLIPTTTLYSNELEPVKAIALLDISDPKGYGNYYFEYNEFSFGKISQVLMKQFLEENGYQVIEYTANRKNKFRLIDDYEKLDIEDADAYLDIVPIAVQYMKKGVLTNNKSMGPHVSFVVRLVSASTNEVIWAGSVQYGWDTVQSVSGIKIDSPDDHRYESHEALNVNKDEAFQRLVYGIEATTASIAKKITKGEFVSVLSTPVQKILSDNESEMASEIVGMAVNEGIYTGIYISSITGNTQILNLKEPQPKVRIVQNGNNIKGTFGDSGGKIWGDIEGDTVKFEWITLLGDSGKGKWTLNPESKVIVGTWYSLWRGEGEWNLTRVE